jgi:hypothetical protein
MTKGKRVMLNVCLILFVISFTGVFLIYTSSFSSSAELPDMMRATLRSIVYTARMFVGEHDYDSLFETHESNFVLNNIIWQIVFWFCHMLALLISISALIAVFGKRIIDITRLTFGFSYPVYVIAGCDANALLLGENIATHDHNEKYKHPDFKRLIVFLTDQEDDEEEINEKIAKFGGILMVIGKSSDILKCIKRIGLGRWRFFKKKYKFILFPNDIIKTEDIGWILEYAAKNQIEKDELGIYVLTSSEWDKNTIESISKTQKLYMLHQADEASLITRKMVLDHSPYECLFHKNIFENGKTIRDFNVMILGFGKIGQYSLLRLTMNGQFVGSHMHAIIVDVDLEDKNLYGRFQQNYPSFELCCEIELYSNDVLSKEFYEKLDEIDNRLNKTSNSIDYIVIALENDEDSKQVGLNLKRHYLLKTNDISTPTICLIFKETSATDNKFYCYNRREDIYKHDILIDQKTDEIAMELNSGLSRNQSKYILWHELDWFSQESKRAQIDFLPVVLKLAKLNEKQIDRMKNLGEINYNIDECKRKLGDIKEINKLIIKLNKELEKINNLIDKYDKEHNKEKINKEKEKVENIIKEKEKAEKERAEKEKDKAKVDNEKKLAEEEKAKIIKEINIDESLVETLAETEHLRWNAFHASMGYLPMELNEMHNRYEKYKKYLGEADHLTSEQQKLCRNDPILKLHLCLVPWDKLDENYSAYLEIDSEYTDFKKLDRDNLYSNIPKYIYKFMAKSSDITND